MRYLASQLPLRLDPSRLIPGARSAICTAVRYKRDRPPSAPGPHPGAQPPAQPPSGRVAMYARGDDYHVVLRRMLERLIAALHERIEVQFEARAFVDTGPLIERELAAAAGVGWIGKNTLVMHESLGSYLFLGEIVTTLDLAPDAPATDHCGTCTRCLDACPTQAFPAAYQMDASRCISYLTIEHRGEIPPELAARMSDWVYGCDVCQEVCPHNAKAPMASHPELTADRIPARLPLDPLTRLTAGEYRRLTRRTAARRATRRMWQRNAALLLANRVHPAET